ncbi:MAG TPA: D-tyrosyl-tRNA(Tyr) deacylase [Flavobacteriales bacterium]|nr:D-tyrosyl-tRNA(Tyr) deacylase [Flavobacteriales bacterium]
MRAVIQRVDSASVSVDGIEISHIQKGLLVLLGVEEEDTNTDAEWLSQKICYMRIFSDASHKMNLDVRDVSGEIMVISQFTLHASTKKGNRPSFIKSARAEKAESLYHYFISTLQAHINSEVKKGKFGAMMNVSLINNGPVTILIDSKNKD